MASIILNNSNACEADTQVSLLSHIFIEVHKDRKEWESFDTVGVQFFYSVFMQFLRGKLVNRM